MNNSILSNRNLDIVSDNDIINVGIIACGMHGAVMSRGAYGSLLHNPAKRKINLHLVFDKDQDVLMQMYCKKLVYPTLLPEFHNVSIINYDNNPYIQGVFQDFQRRGISTTRFRCALIKLVMPQIWPDVDDMLLIDADTLVLEDLTNLWPYLMNNKHNHSIGGVLETEPPLPNGYIYPSEKKHIYPPSSLNTGVMYMNLKRLRDNNMTVTRFLDEDDELAKCKLLDQDILNTWAYYHQEEIFLLPCRWNKRRNQNCEHHLYRNNTGILHGNGGAFYNIAKVPWAKALYDKYEDIYTKYCMK